MASKKKPKTSYTRKELRAMYAKAKREFSLEDLRAFEVEEKDTIPFSSVLTELKVMISKAKSKRKSG
jgi:hypothetical protein